MPQRTNWFTHKNFVSIISAILFSYFECKFTKPIVQFFDSHVFDTWYMQINSSFSCLKSRNTLFLAPAHCCIRSYSTMYVFWCLKKLGFSLLRQLLYRSQTKSGHQPSIACIWKQNLYTDYWTNTIKRFHKTKASFVLFISSVTM